MCFSFLLAHRNSEHEKMPRNVSIYFIYLRYCIYRLEIDKDGVVCDACTVCSECPCAHLQCGLYIWHKSWYCISMSPSCDDHQEHSRQTQVDSSTIHRFDFFNPKPETPCAEPKPREIHKSHTTSLQNGAKWAMAKDIPTKNNQKLAA